MSTLENNKLIAEFMGGLYNNQSRLNLQSNEIWLPYHGVCNYKSDNGKSLNYHSSWDWLMEVVKRITTLEEFQYYDGNSLFWDEFCSLDVDSVYSQCVEFINGIIIKFRF